jgi:hypothetical protein
MTAPALAVDGGDKIGRLYRHPEQPLPDDVRYDDNGRPYLRHRDAQAHLLSGRLLPSITNVIGVRDKPHLLRWTGKMVAQEAVRIAQQYPERITASPAKAVDYLKEAANRDRDGAAEQGDAVHNACEDLARGLPCPALPPAQMLYVDAWKAWLDRWQPEFLALEATVYGRAGGLNYAGTGDLIFRAAGLTIAADYKTTRSGIHADVALQLSAIAHAAQMSPDNETLAPMLSVDAGVAIHLSPEGYQVKPVVLDEDVWEVFRAAGFVVRTTLPCRIRRVKR